MIPEKTAFPKRQSRMPHGLKYMRRRWTVKEAKTVKRKTKYTDELPRQLYTFFISQSAEGVPSFDKFARSIGATLKEIEDFRKHSEFERAYCECNEIRRDYLIDAALTRRYDPSLVKFLLSAEFGMGEKEKEKEETGLTVTLEVLGEDGDKS